MYFCLQHPPESNTSCQVRQGRPARPSTGQRAASPRPSGELRAGSRIHTRSHITGTLGGFMSRPGKMTAPCARLRSPVTPRAPPRAACPTAQAPKAIQPAPARAHGLARTGGGTIVESGAKFWEGQVRGAQYGVGATVFGRHRHTIRATTAEPRQDLPALLRRQAGRSGDQVAGSQSRNRP